MEIPDLVGSGFMVPIPGMKSDGNSGDAMPRAGSMEDANSKAESCPGDRCCAGVRPPSGDGERARAPSIEQGPGLQKSPCRSLFIFLPWKLQTIPSKFPSSIRVLRTHCSPGESLACVGSSLLLLTCCLAHTAAEGLYQDSNAAFLRSFYKAYFREAFSITLQMSAAAQDRRPDQNNHRKRADNGYPALSVMGTANVAPQLLNLCPTNILSITSSPQSNKSQENQEISLWVKIKSRKKMVISFQSA
ncbi:hypothetical protein MUG91_G154n4 [Manis pentadactyla]|nr:hypothetical protein MUG91_G154n4 [Manis pentadactyla]